MTVTDTPVRLRGGRGLDRASVQDLAAGFEATDPTTVIAWAVETFRPRLALTASFADTLLIDLATAVDPDIEVLFIDTGFHFAETLETLRAAMVRYSLNLTVLRPSPAAPDRWSHGFDRCCGARKVAPLERHLLAHTDAWLSGLRRDDSAERARSPIVELDRRGLVKVNPLAVWSTEQLDRYVLDHDVLVNPLAPQGYESIGCWPCTEPTVGAPTRSGRWRGSTKTECGIHR